MGYDTRIASGALRRVSARLCLLVAAALICAGAASPAHATPQQGTFVIFNVPGGAFDTTVKGINPAGAVTGWTFDGTVSLGFVRALDGTITTIAVPGSTATFVGAQTEPFAGPPINPAGAITGSYADASGLMHGFLRASNGTFTTFDAPGSVNGTDFLCCITPAGAVAGISFDANSVGHGFLRAPNGTFTIFDLPGSAITAPSGITPEAAISGIYFDTNFIGHGFFRAPDGTITTFDVPGAVNGTWPGGITPAGVIAGEYFDANPGVHGFVRALDGTITKFDVPGSIFFGALFGGINPLGAIVGSYFDGITFHGFRRAPDGTFTTVDPPGSASTNPGPGGINPAGVIVGSYSDASEVARGFLFFPQ